MTTHHEISVDDETVAAVHHEADSDRWLVFCHGFVSDKTGSYESRCERAVAEGYNGVRFDFRGCGESSRSFGEQTLTTRIADLRAVLSYFDPPEVVLFGSSFGGKVAFHVGVAATVDAIATRAPVTYNRAFEKYRVPASEPDPSESPDGSAQSVSPDESNRPEPIVGPDADFFADLDSYPFETVAHEIAVPVAIFHGREDHSVAPVDSLEAAGALETDTLIELYAEEGHRFSRSAEQRMRDRFFEWLGPS